MRLIANIIWQGTDGKWTIEDAEKIGFRDNFIYDFIKNNE